MNLILFYDTETTGLPVYSLPSSHPDQPHIVQLAACLVDSDTRKIVSSMDVMIEPDGWEIPAETTAIHGISTEHAKAVGMSATLALAVFDKLHSKAIVRSAHNESVDARMVRIMQYQVSKLKECDTHPDDASKGFAAWKSAPAICTMKLARTLVKAPPTQKMLASGNNHKYKNPSLAEAYQHFTGKPLENAHSAMADVFACMAVYFAIKDLANAEA
jgi:DNA polymerase III subunit epsilon